ncbi:phage gp6-like head-tail connector protein [Cetobacterium sp. 2A]|uniref:head-tail connector protein n=1 Tax=Cetobacterium sp. 2A TaxID=2754723 RepID=UPI00163CFBA0|nr:head-tail connector protein [Cetobacterium sp. 2A]MBC2855253.1 phage gp6-like head-tail connector protein [Cetobacterium sp. 2A]MBC2855302.1 phage gp6-like head-tail connector protein [Cetobacterium sp. 2A]
MIDLTKTKEYLRIDESDEDNFIEMLIEFSKEEIANSTGVTFDSGGSFKTYELAQLIIITDRYENRGSQDLEFKPNNILSSLYTKLKYSDLNV